MNRKKSAYADQSDRAYDSGSNPTVNAKKSYCSKFSKIR